MLFGGVHTGTNPRTYVGDLPGGGHRHPLAVRGQGELRDDRLGELRRLQEAARALRREYESRGRGEAFELLKGYLSGKDPGQSYRLLASRPEATERTIAVMIHRPRQRYRRNEPEDRGGDRRSARLDFIFELTQRNIKKHHCCESQHRAYS